MSHIVALNDWKRATRMWRAGKNTLEIATAIGCPEALIYNRLPHWLTMFRDNPLGVGTVCAIGKRASA